MFNGWPDIITFDAMGGKRISLGRRIVDDDFGPRDGEWGSIKIKIPE